MLTKQHPGQLQNPFDLSISRPLMAARFACLMLVIAAVASGMPVLEWMSVPVLLLVIVAVWGRHVLFADNLNALPHLRAEQPVTANSPELPPVTLIVPTRNEIGGIEAAVRSLAATDYPDLEILVVDDHSSDGTSEVLQRLACDLPQVRVLAAPDVPDGWAGKPHAAWFGFLQSNPHARWLVFSDARIVFHRNAVRRAVEYAEGNHLGFLSCIIRYDGESVIEELIANIQNRALVISARAFGGGAPKVPFGLGAFQLIRRDVYTACGGHSTYPDHPIEDFILAGLASRQGKASAAIASEVLSLRRYRGFGDMRQRVVRSLRLATSDRTINLADRISQELLLQVLPLPLAVGGLVRQLVTHRFQPVLALVSLLALAAYIAGICTPRSCRKICGCRRRAAWLHPLGGALWVLLLLLAITDRMRGRPITWSGRKMQTPSGLATA